MVGLVLPLLLLAGAERPIVAVFPVQDRRGVLSGEQAAQLTDYFGVKIAEGGVFLVVPRTDLEAALREQKKASYGECVDESCQIEIGKELAAQKVLHTMIVALGDRCAVTATLYDLRLSATEQAASHKGGCDANALVESLEEVARRLTGGSGAPGRPPAASPGVAEVRPSPPRADERTLRIESEPPGADVLVEGRSAGRTPAAVTLPRGAPRAISVELAGYEPHAETVALERDERRSIALRMEPERKRARNEWVGLGLSYGLSGSAGMGPGLWVRLFNLHFGSVTLNLVESMVGAHFSQITEDPSSCGPEAGQNPTLPYCRQASAGVAFYVGPRLGYKVTIQEDHNLELQLGGGLFALVGDIDEQVVAPALSPGVRYLHLGDGAFSWGIGLRAILPLTSEACADRLGGEVSRLQQSGAISEYASCRNGHPQSFFVEIPFGWYF